METEKVLMGQKQLRRWHLIKMVEGRKITLREAGEKMKVSYRHAKRVRRAIRDRGIKGGRSWQSRSALKASDR